MKIINIKFFKSFRLHLIERYPDFVVAEQNFEIQIPSGLQFSNNLLNLDILHRCNSQWLSHDMHPWLISQNFPQRILKCKIVRYLFFKFFILFYIHKAIEKQKFEKFIIFIFILIDKINNKKSFLSKIIILIYSHDIEKFVLDRWGIFVLERRPQRSW